MLYRTFGNTDLNVSEIGFGAWAIGGPAMAGDIPIGWGDVDDDTSINALNTALDQGINFFDTADFYGHGHSEALIGKTFGNRPDVVIATKVGHRLDEDANIYLDYSKKYVIEACKKSLRRLKRETIDFYQLHAAKLEHLQKGDCIEAMEQLKKEGKIRYWGISLNTYDPEPEAKFMFDQMAGSGFQVVFNIINQKALPILQEAAEKGMGIIARMPLQFGLLTGKFKKSTRFDASDHRSFRLTPDVLTRSLMELEALWPLTKPYGIPLDAFALSFVLSHPEVSTVIPGIKTPQQVLANICQITQLKKEDIDSIHALFDEHFEDLLQYMKEHG
jgi:aryl-alcohol dehydrogenase-like predicted oxidoreductase